MEQTTCLLIISRLSPLTYATRSLENAAKFTTVPLPPLPLAASRCCHKSGKRVGVVGGRSQAFIVRHNLTIGRRGDLGLQLTHADLQKVQTERSHNNAFTFCVVSSAGGAA